MNAYIPKPISKHEMEYREKQEQKKNINKDIEKIVQVLQSISSVDLQEVHMFIDGKYGAYVSGWSKGMYGYFIDYGFNYEYLDNDSLVHNLKLMKAKLEGFSEGFELLNGISPSSQQSVNVSLNNTNENSNEINVAVSFEQARQRIQDSTALTDAETQDILDKINEIEQVVKGNGSKKSKWEKVKPVLVWLADKSCDVGIALLPLLLQIGG